MASLINTLIGEYRVLTLLGTGGMGEVYQARHTHFGHLIAIKALLPGQTDSSTLRRFYGEASIQASLRHPGVAEYLGFYEHQGRPCILMEYVNGETIADILRRRGIFAPKEAIVILSSVAEVAAHFHGLGVVHRDIKSSNIKITSTANVKILDFGIARFQSTRYTTTGTVVGTPAVLSPEQVRGNTATPATDVWQLGVLAYEMLTGTLPFQGDNLTELYARILNAPYRPISDFQPAPSKLEKIVTCCLQKDPRKRFASGKELVDALDHLQQESRVVSAKPKTGSSPSTSIRLRVAVLWTAAVLSLVVVAALAFRLLEGTTDLQDVHASTESKTVIVDTFNGKAEVFRDGSQIGLTPYELHAKAGQKVDLLLRRPGYKDLPVHFEVTERKMYTYTMESSGER